MQATSDHIYTQIVNGLVHYLFTAADMPEWNETQITVVDVTAVSPAPAVGWSYAGGTFSAPPAPPAPTLAQQASAMLAAGCAIASTATPAVNGTYALDTASRAAFGEVVAGINTGDGLPGGGSSFIYDDPCGAHTFTTTAEVLAVGKGMRDFIYAAMQVIAGRSITLPAQPWPIP
jgi:hypothetical protein